MIESIKIIVFVQYIDNIISFKNFFSLFFFFFMFDSKKRTFSESLDVIELLIIIEYIITLFSCLNFFGLSLLSSFIFNKSFISYILFIFQ